MRNKLFAVSMLSLFGGDVRAQSAFEGFYAQIGAGYQSVSPTKSIATSFNEVNVPSTINANDFSSFAATTTLGYTGVLSNHFSLGIGAEYSPLPGPSRQQTISLFDRNTPIGSTQEKNAYNLFIAPGLTVGDDGLAYIKVGYSGMQVSANTSINYTGYSLGLGYKQFIAGDLYGFGEMNYLNYGNQTISQSSVISTRRVVTTISSSVSVTNFLLGMGYRF